MNIICGMHEPLSYIMAERFDYLQMGCQWGNFKNQELGRMDHS